MKRKLLALALLFGFVWPVLADDAQPLTAILLTARAELSDSYFENSVVLVMNNVGPTPAGVILNRPTPIEVGRLFPDLGLGELDDKVYLGGPVALPTVSFLFRAETPPAEHAVRVLDGVYLSTNLELLRALLMREKPTEGLRIFIGYSGWALGQLEAEIARGDWTLAPADANSIFERRPERPWPDGSARDDGPKI